MKWHTVKIQEAQEVDFEQDKPSFTGTIDNNPVKVELDAEKHAPFYRADADNISVKGDLADGVIQAEMIRSYKMMSITATVGHIDDKEKSKVITAFDNEDKKEDKSQRYFLKVDPAKLDQSEKQLMKGGYITAKGYVIETAKGDRQMNVLGMKVLKEKKQEQDKQTEKTVEAPKTKKKEQQSM